MSFRSLKFEAQLEDLSPVEAARLSILDLSTVSSQELALKDYLISILESLDQIGRGRAVFAELLLIINECFSRQFEEKESTLRIFIDACQKSPENVVVAIVAEAAHCHSLNIECEPTFGLWFREIALKRELHGFAIPEEYADLVTVSLIDIVHIEDVELLKFVLNALNGVVSKRLFVRLNKPDCDRVLERVRPELFCRLFEELGHDEFLAIVAPVTGMIPKAVSSKLRVFEPVDFLMSHLEEPHVYLAESVVKDAIMLIRDRKQLVSVLRPGLRHPIVMDPGFWNHCFEILEEDDFDEVAQCFVGNCESVAEVAASLVSDDSIYSGKTCAFLEAVLQDSCDRLDFMFSPRIAKLLVGLKRQPLLSFWNLFTCSPPFLRLRGITEGKYPFAFQGLVYTLVQTKKIENEDFASRLVVPELDEEDLEELSVFIARKKKKVEDVFAPFSNRRRLIEFIAIAQYFGIHCPMTKTPSGPMCLGTMTGRCPEEKIRYEGLTTDNIFPFLTIAVEMRVVYYRNAYDGFDSMSQLQKQIMILFDRFIMEMPTPISKLHQVWLIHMYDVFVLSRKMARVDVGQIFSPARGEQHLVVKISRQLWEIDAVNCYPKLRNRFIQSLAMCCDQNVYMMYNQQWGRSSRQDGQFLSSLGRSIIPYVIKSGVYKKSMAKYNLAQFRTALHGTASMFSEYIQDAPLLESISFLDNFSINCPHFTLDIEDDIVALFKQLREEGKTGECAMIAHFMHDNESLGSLNLTDEELLTYVIMEIQQPKSDERMTMANFVSLFLKDEETVRAKMYSVIKSFRCLFFNESQDIHDPLFYSLVGNVREFTDVLKLVYAKAPDDPHVCVIKCVAESIEDASTRSYVLANACLKTLIAEPTTQMFFWCKNLCNAFKFLVAKLDDELVEQVLDTVMKEIADLEMLHEADERSMPMFKHTAAASSFLHTFLSIPRHMDMFYKYMFRDFLSLSMSQLYSCLVIIDSQFNDLETSLLTSCVLSKFKFSSYFPAIIKRLDPRHRMGYYLFTQLSVVCNYYFSELIKATPEKLKACQRYVDETDIPYSDFLQFTDTFVRDGRFVHFAAFGFNMTTMEFQYTRQLERDFFQGLRGMEFYRNLNSLDVPEEPEDLVILPPSIDVETYKALGKRQRAEAFQGLLPTLPMTMNAAMHLYVMKQPYWIRSVIACAPTGLLNPSNYIELIKVYEHLVELQDKTLEQKERGDMLDSVLCNIELYETMIPLIGDKRWKRKEDDIQVQNRSMVFMNPIMQKKKHQTLTLFLEAALRYKPAVNTYVEAFRDLLPSSSLEKLIPAVTFLAQRVRDSTVFEKCFCEDILPRCLEPHFRTSNKLMARLASVVIKYCQDDEKQRFNQKIVQLMIFFFMNGDEDCFEAALKLGECLSAEDRLWAGPFVQYFFDQYVREGTPDANVHWMKVCRVFKYLALNAENDLVETLDDLLTNYRPNKITQIGALLNILAPRKVENPMTDSLSSRLPAPPINIPPSLYAEAPVFWNIVAKHQNRLTDITRTHIELVDTSLTFVVKFPVLLDVMLKISLFQHMMQIEQGFDTTIMRRDGLSMSINRVTIVADSMKFLADVSPERLFEPINVQFRGEDGIDAGGVTRDWFGCLSTELFGQAMNLFVPTANGRSLHVNKDSGTTADILGQFRFAGRFMAMAMAHNIAISAHLTSSLYKFLIGTPLSIRDMEQIDESVARSIQQILDGPVDGLMLDFTVGAEENGQPITVELKPGGADIPVTEENKLEYVQLHLNYYFRNYAAVQISSFLDGFFEVIPKERLKMFTADELDLVICGIPEIDIEDLQKNCKIVDPYTRKHPVIRTFFNVLRNWKSDDLVRLLQFVTGSSQVPAGGFATLTDQGRPFAIAPGGDENRLPVAHVCSNQLDLPNYSSEALMNDKLLCAVRNCSGFGKA